MIAAKPLRRQEDTMWKMEDPALLVAANEGAARSKLLTHPWEELYELGRDELPREVPDLRRQILDPPRTLVVRVRRSGLDWPQWHYFGLVEVPDQPEVEPEEDEETADEETPEAPPVEDPPSPPEA